MEERLVRSEEIRLIKTDMPAVNIRFTGRSKSMRATSSDRLWQIQLEYKVGDVVTSTYAIMGQFECTWDDRASYFPATTPDPTNPLDNLNVTVSQTSLHGSGIVTDVTLNDATWTALPPTPLVGRSAVAVQNNSGQSVKINYDNTEPGFVGVLLPDGQDRFYDISDQIVQYAKSSSGAAVIQVEELS
jgi:hypothetical protein